MWTNKPPLGTQLNLAHPLSRGLIGYWPMNERMGDKVNDISGNRNTGACMAMSFPPAATSGWNPGLKGSCLSFDGTSDYINVNHNVMLNPTNTITVIVWAKFSALVDNETILRKGQPIAGQEGYTIRFQTNVFRYFFYDSINTCYYDN